MSDVEKILSIGANFRITKLFFPRGQEIRIECIYFLHDELDGSRIEIEGYFKSEEEAIDRVFIECKKYIESRLDHYRYLKEESKEKANEYGDISIDYLKKLDILNS